MNFDNIKIPYYTNNQIAQIANNLLTSIGCTPPIEVDLLAEKKGFDLIPMPGLRNLSSTDAYLSHNKKEIAYDPDVASVRIRFSIAHELGYYYLHKEILSEVRFADYREWREFLKEIPGWFWGKVESQANEFAGQLLVPRDMLIQVMADYREEIKAAHDFIPDDIAAIQEYLAIPLSKRFEVSEIAMKIRLSNERINPYDLI